MCILSHTHKLLRGKKEIIQLFEETMGLSLSKLFLGKAFLSMALKPEDEALINPTP